MDQLFYTTSVIAILSVSMAITRRNPVHALLYLILSLLSISVILFIYGAPFIAVLEVIIYAGAIMVLFIFVVMMLNIDYKNKPGIKPKPKAWIVPAALALVLAGELIHVLMSSENYFIERTSVSSKEIGLSLFGKYGLAVMLAAMLMMAGTLGAYHLGRSKQKTFHRFLKMEEV
jgi:NADH-quinone oxidoreductase subunit J